LWKPEYGDYQIRQMVVNPTDAKPGTPGLGDHLMTLEKTFKEDKYPQVTAAIPTLKEYSPDVNYVIELKKGANQVAAFEAAVEATGVREHTVVESFDFNALYQVKQNPTYMGMPAMALVGTGEINQLNTLLTGPNKSLIDLVCMDKIYMNYSYVNQIQTAGKQAFFFTLNTLDELNYAKYINADGYFTNFTKEALATALSN
jgi:hypothetical protein